MSASPFTFYRGTALNMAADLAGTPVTGVRAQVCGDCHLMNFGGFATPERRVIFDINDFDETLPGPWEWDIKRLAASFVLAARSNGLDAADQREAAMTCVRSYRERIAEYADMRALDVWYARIDMDAVAKSLSDAETRPGYASASPRPRRIAFPTATFPKMVEGSGGRFVIKDAPPLIYHDQSVNMVTDRDNIVEAPRPVRKDASGGSPGAVRPLPASGLRVEGGRRGQRRHLLCDRADDGRRR